MALRKFDLPGSLEGALVSPELLFSGRQPFYLSPIWKVSPFINLAMSSEFP